MYLAGWKKTIKQINDKLVNAAILVWKEASKVELTGQVWD